MTQPPIPMVLSAANASAAAWISRGQKRFSGMTDSNGSNHSRIQDIVALDSVESFLLSVLGSRIRTQAFFSMGISLGR